jgi:multiple sugar transport system permease protein
VTAAGATPATRDGRAAGRAGTRRYLARVGFYLFAVFVTAYFFLPLLWLVLAPFDQVPTLAAEVPDFTLSNFAEMTENPLAVRSLGNSVLLAGGAMLLVVLTGAPAAYALSRVRFAGRDVMLYVLLLFSSVVTGSAAMVPLFLLVFNLGLTDTYLGVILVLVGGLLPAGIFILKDFTDSMPSSLEESARVFGASSWQVLKDIVVPVVRPGLAVIAVWVVVNVWGNFLMPFILLRSPERSPAAVVMYSFYTEGGQANLAVVAAFSLLYTVPVLVLYVFVNRRYGFRFYGGIKG